MSENKHKNTRIAVVCVFHNEEDILELFIKHNLDVADKLFLIDHFSTDNSAAIVESLSAQGYDIELRQAFSRSFNQPLEITAEVNKVAALSEFDYIIPLDADEFLPFIPGGAFQKELAEKIKHDEYGYMKWRTYCPKGTDYWSPGNPLLDCFVARSCEPVQFHKVVIGGTLARTCAVDNGNHALVGAGSGRDPQVLTYPLQHVPVRSSEQILVKALLGSYTMLAKARRKKNDNYHWIELADSIRRNDYLVSLDLLQELSLFYAVKPEEMQGASRPELTNERMQLSDRHRIDLPELRRSGLVKRLDQSFVKVLENKIVLDKKGGWMDRLLLALDKQLSRWKRKADAQGPK